MSTDYCRNVLVPNCLGSQVFVSRQAASGGMTRYELTMCMPQATRPPLPMYAEHLMTFDQGRRHEVDWGGHVHPLLPEVVSEIDANPVFLLGEGGGISQLPGV